MKRAEYLKDSAPLENAFNPYVRTGADIVTLAVEKDSAADYEEALPLYRQALEHFMKGLEFEQNAIAKARLMEKVEEYMKRAEFLKHALHHSNENLKLSGGHPHATKEVRH